MSLKTNKINIYNFVRAEMKEKGNQEQTGIYWDEVSTKIVWHLLQILMFFMTFTCG